MKVRIDLCDMGPGFSKTNNFFTNLLQQRFEIEWVDCPDFLLYFDPNRHVHRLHNCVRIQVGTEWYLPDWTECDYAFSSNYLDDPRHLRLPFYAAWRDGPKPLIRKPTEDSEKLLAEKTGFCSWVVSTNHPTRNRKRVEFFEKLSRYKKVDSGGKFMNNIGGPIPWGWDAKVQFLRRYKFNLAFENESHEGYTTEKIYDPMMARSVPIYWGNPRIADEFNPKSFLNYFDYGSDEALLEKIIELDRDDAKYLEYLRQPYFHGNQPNEYFSPDRLLDFFQRIFTTRIEPVSWRRGAFEVNRWVLARKNRPHPLPF